MTEVEWTIVLQLAIGAALGWISWGVYNATRTIKRIDGLVQQYRREVHWLTSRMDALEAVEQRHK